MVLAQPPHAVPASVRGDLVPGGGDAGGGAFWHSLPYSAAAALALGYGLFLRLEQTAGVERA